MINWQDGDWEVICDAADGGRIGSIRWRGRELLTEPHLVGGEFVAPAEDYGQYETRPVFGYDDCWPCLEVCVWPGMGCDIRDHGELVWLDWDARIEDGVLVARVTDQNGNWRFERRALVSDGTFVFEYTCANTGSVPFPMSWAGHVLIPPAAVTDLSLPAFDHLRQGSMHGGGEPWQAPEDVWTYLHSLPTGEATFLVLENLSGNSLRLRFNDLDWRWSVEGISNAALGLWYNLSGYPDPDNLARAEFGIEWMTSPACALENAPGATEALVLQPGEKHTWRMKWEIGLFSPAGMESASTE